MVDTIDRHLFDDEYVIIKFNHTSCVCLSCYLQKELVSIVGSYCTLSLKSLVATLQYYHIKVLDEIVSHTFFLRDFFLQFQLVTYA